MKIGKRKAASLLALAVFGVLGTSATANASTGADGFPVLRASVEQFAHQCIVLGSDNQGTQGVMCADVETYPTGNGSYQAVGQIEAYCQTGSGSTATELTCAQVHVSGTFANGAGGRNGMGEYDCGHQFGSCASLRNEWESSWFGWDTTTGCDSNPNSSYDVWTVILGGGESGIELPGSDKWVYLVYGNDGLGESSGHNYVCW
ncbi:MAG TPA: hypothetical protein VF223_14150 [Trebonia sp.]